MSAGSFEWVLARITAFECPGLVLRRGWRGRFTITYGEILTAERLASGLGLRLRTPVRANLSASSAADVAEWRWRTSSGNVVFGSSMSGARSFAPTLEDFETDDHVFTVEVEQWVSAYQRERRRKDPKRPSSDQALMRMVWRVCKRAGVRRLSPHQLRHGFATRFLRESGRDFVALQALMGHSRPDTTQQYTDEVELDELAEALGRRLLPDTDKRRLV